MNRRKWDINGLSGATANSSCKKIRCTQIPVPFMGMGDESDSSESDPESLAQVTVGYNRKSIKRTANSGKEFARIKRRKHPRRHLDDSSHDEPPKQLSRRSPHSITQVLPGESEKNFQNPLVSACDITHSDPQVLPGGSGRSFQNPFSTVSDISPNFLENLQQYECELKRLPPDYEELLSSYPQLISSNEVLPSENLSENLYLFEFPCNSTENYSVIEDPKIIDTSASDPLNNLISFRNLEQSFHVIRNTDNLLQDQPNSLDNSDVSSRKKNSFKPSCIFRNLLHTPNNNEVEEFSCEHRIFQPNFPKDVHSEDEHIFRNIRNVFESEGKLKDSTGQAETWSVHQTVDKGIFQNPSDQGNQNCYDWDKFLERWEGMHVISDSISEAQHHELKTIEGPKIYLPASSTSKGRKRKKSTSNSSPSVTFNGQTKKRPCIAESPETITSSFKSSSSDEERGSNQNFVLPSFEKEMEIIVHPISSNISEANTSSKLEKFIKNTKIKLLEDDQIPPFVEKFISFDSESLPNRTNGSVSNDSYEILQVDTKGKINLLKNQIQVEENIFGGTNNSDKIEELTGVDRDPSVFDDDSKMIS